MPSHLIHVINIDVLCILTILQKQIKPSVSLSETGCKSSADQSVKLVMKVALEVKWGDHVVLNANTQDFLPLLLFFVAENN